MDWWHGMYVSKAKDLYVLSLENGSTPCQISPNNVCRLRIDCRRATAVPCPYSHERDLRRQPLTDLWRFFFLVFVFFVFFFLSSAKNQTRMGSLFTRNI